MGKVLSVVCKVAAPLACVVNPVIGVVLASTAAISNIVQADQERKKINTAIDQRLQSEYASAISAEESRLAAHLTEIHKLYNQHYSHLSQSKAVMEEYYLTIKTQLVQEKIIIDNLEEVLEILDCCARKSNENLIERLNKFREQITVLLHWGLMHIVILSGEECSYEYILSLSNHTLDCLALDHLGHSMLEYAYLLGDLKLVQDLKNSTKILNKHKNFKLAEIALSERKLLPGSFCRGSNEADVLNCIQQEDYNLAEALIILEKLPIDLKQGEYLIKELLKMEQHKILEKLLMIKSEYITLELINELELLYPEPRNYSKEYSLNRIKAYFWLNKNQFNNLDQLHPITNETALEFAVIKNNYDDFLNLLICKADPGRINYNGENLLEFAIRHQKNKIVEYLIKYHKMDPFVYNNQGVSALVMLEAKSEIFKGILSYINNNFNKQFITSSKLEFIPLLDKNIQDFFAIARESYNLWKQGKFTACQARMPIILGLYIFGIRNMIPWSEKELPWLVEKLGLNVKVLPSGKKYQGNNINPEEIEITITSNGSIATWKENSIEILEADFQYIDPYDHDLSFIESNNFNAIENYINSNYIMLQNFLLKFKQSSKFDLELWSQSSSDSLLRIDELPNSSWIQYKKLPNFSVNFSCYYQMPLRDAGYQAFGISRITASKLLLNHLKDPEILECIRVEWVNWLLSFYHLPEELNKIPEIHKKFNNYLLIKQAYEQEPENHNKLIELNISIANLYDLSNIDYCATYIAKIISAPHNYLNSLKYYPANGYLKVGGCLIALARIIKIGLKIWQIIDNLECVFTYEVLGSRDTINILQNSEIYNELTNIAILSNNEKMKLKPVVTHIDLFANSEPDSDLGAILHGWFCALSGSLATTPQNDLLALLLQVKKKLSNYNLDNSLFEEIKKYRYQLSKELSQLFCFQMQTGRFVENNWVKIAEYRVREIARRKLLQEHCNLLEDYKNHYELLKEKISLEIEEKFDTLQQQYAEILDNFDKSLLELKTWYDIEEKQAILQSEDYKLSIYNKIQNGLSIEHEQVKRQYKKSIKNIVIDWCVNNVISILPKPKDLPMEIMQNTMIKVINSGLKDQKLKFNNLCTFIGSKIISQLEISEKALQQMFREMAKNLINNIFNGNFSKDLLRNTIIEGIGSIYNFGLKNHIKFSDNYIQSIIHSSINGVLESFKKGEFSLENILQKISNELANNIKIKNRQNLNSLIMYNNRENFKIPTNLMEIEPKTNIDRSPVISDKLRKVP